MALTRLGRSAAVVTMALAFAIVTGTGATQAVAADMQAQIDATLAQSPGGKQISANQVAWNNGTVVLTIPLPGEKAARGPGEPVTTLGTANCPYTWTCLYDHENFDGRRLQFSECGYVQDLGAYGFNDRASSWHNNQTPGTKSWVYDWTGSWTRIWTEGGAPAKSTNVGEGNNDRADGIKAC